MKTAILHPEAEAEFEDAVAYYERQRKGLGLDFHDVVASALARIEENPRLHSAVNDEGVRKCVIRRFPYTIYYAEFDDYVWVAAIAHQKRQPGYWVHRRPE